MGTNLARSRALSTLVAAMFIGGCTRGDDAAEPTAKDLDDSGSPADTSGVDTDSTDTTHTGTVVGTSDTGRPTPTVCGEPLERPVRLVGDEPGDFTGRWLDAADLDGDGCDELVVSESWDFGQYGLGGIRSAAHLVQHPLLSGDLHDVAFATFEGSGASNGLDYWGAPSALLPATRQVVVGGQRDNQTLDYPSTCWTYRTCRRTVPSRRPTSSHPFMHRLPSDSSASLRP